MSSELPPNQVWGKKFVIYAALGIPRIKPEDWSFKVDGLVEKPLEFTYDQMVAMPQTREVKSFHCLLPDSLVYANPEPKKIQDIRVGDFIIGRDGRRHKVRKLIQRPHHGEVVGVKATYLPAVLMTPDHPVLTIQGHPGVGQTRSNRRKKTFQNNPSPRWLPAEELRTGDYVFFPKYRETSIRKFVRIGPRVLRIDKRLASVLGWYVAEGSGGDSVGRNVTFSLNSSEESEVERLRADLNELFGANTSVYSNERGTLSRVVITSSDCVGLLRALKEWCGEDAESKKIPDFILNANKEVLKAFLVNYFLGDGYSPWGQTDRGSDFIDLTTISKILAHQLLLALSKLEIPAGIVNHPGSVRDGFSVRVRGDKLSILFPDFPSFNKVNKFHYWETPAGFYYPIKQIWREKYDGPVYDFQAPGLAMLSPFVTQDCVTRWSIKDAQWEGVSIRGLLDQAVVKPEAKWVMFHCADGYTTPVPLEYAMREDAVLAFRVNGNPLSSEQGFPARPFFPELYGWKSAKWANRMELIPGYKDGYWEMYGYHERADVREEERFKGHSGKAILRKAFGTA